VKQGVSCIHLHPVPSLKECLFLLLLLSPFVVVLLFLLRYLRFLILPSLSGIRDSTLPNFCLVNTHSVPLMPTVSACPQPSPPPPVSFRPVPFIIMTIYLIHVWNAPSPRPTASWLSCHGS